MMICCRTILKKVFSARSFTFCYHFNNAVGTISLVPVDTETFEILQTGVCRLDLKGLGIEEN
jgi:hypothetical protein